MSEKRNTLPQGWEVVTLSKVVQINSGIALPSIFKDKEYFNGGEIPFYKVAQMNNHHSLMTTAELYFSEVIAKKEKIKIFPKGSILIPKRGGAILTNKKRMLIVDASYDSNIMGLKAINKVLSDEFLFAFLESIDLAKFVDTTTIPQINNKHIDMMDIPLPPLEEQRRIVGKLDGLFGKIDKSIALLDESIASASSLMLSALNEVFEELKIKNEMVAIKQVIVNIQTGTTPSKQIEKYYKVPLEIEWFSPSDFKEEKILHNSKNKLNKIALEERKVKLYDENSLLLVAIGATVGKIGVIREKATSNQQITALKFDNSINVDFAYYWFKHIKEFIIGQASTATLPIINQNGIKELPFIKVPLDIQTQTVAYLDALHVKVDALKKAQEKKKEELLALKASLLESAFKGEL